MQRIEGVFYWTLAGIFLCDEQIGKYFSHFAPNDTVARFSSGRFRIDFDAVYPRNPDNRVESRCRPRCFGSADADEGSHECCMLTKTDRFRAG